MLKKFTIKHGRERLFPGEIKIHQKEQRIKEVVYTYTDGSAAAIQHSNSQCPCSA